MHLAAPAHRDRACSQPSEDKQKKWVQGEQHQKERRVLRMRVHFAFSCQHNHGRPQRDHHHHEHRTDFAEPAMQVRTISRDQ